jgi:hypothetical protein
MSIPSRDKRRKKLAPIQVPDDPVINLMDMLAGWNAYVINPADIPATGRIPAAIRRRGRSKSDQIGDLYQAAGNLNNPSNDDIRAFVINRIIPVILGDQ